MIVSHEHKFIFVHIPRTAGTRISKSLCEAMGVEEWQSFIGEPKSVAVHSDTPDDESSYNDPHRSRFEGRKHIPARKLRKEIGEETWNEYFSFAFVRNPWARTLSTYFHRRKVKPAFLRALWPKGALLFQLGLFLKYDLLKKDGSSQIDFVTDQQGEIIVDYIGRFENLASDFSYVCDRIGLNTEIGDKYDPTKHKDYTNYYGDYTRELIARAKSKDIERFDYEFSSR